ncbi:helix-turn-helix domain-containing protein [Geomesophilobacter sediminis]|uniref:DDE-type integrase/transposase/recombinase n=1 Tax=Geomesophilobacter sediminis TaxID=2798584 RepID=A0A8J7M291_9BACT|nr:helix-turn-helix domain-containing protein [Geomesophilobacter sediminis]MBJ6727347.1 DDE-type integrase/transposase/recombinase [Geomesophilobacter sediminis]
MKDKSEADRIWAVQRFLNGEKPETICSTLGRSRAWLYKWVDRHIQGDDSWCESLSRRPLSSSTRTSSEIEEIVKMIRLSLYNRDQFCGAQAILWELEDLDVEPLPSLRTINRILSRNDLTHRRTGKYEPKGKSYPKLPAMLPNQTHQADIVGPCYLKGPVRFYGLNVIDTATCRCGLHPAMSKAATDILEGFWGIWTRMGLPERIQVDNAMTFFGSYAHPRGMGQFIRLCLHNGIEPWFIPMAEPWRNGMVEKFNDHYQQKFLAKVAMTSEEDLSAGSSSFEHRHNSTYRYSKLGGKTPLKALASAQKSLRFPREENLPQMPLEKPKAGRYHIVRFIRSDRNLNLFGEIFKLPPELAQEYVVATIDVKEQKMKLFLDRTQVEEYDYKQ